ncbi:MAG TPA: phosphate-starvation-inducible PsiE family protein, partial [Steroidobacteraceae bacterium]|nr:phosphate-starvation-inducible PsiE family protein [Steroidobacteraceae bacterium]
MSFQERFWQAFDRWVLRALQIMLAIGIVAALAIMAVLLVQGLWTLHGRVDTVPELQRAVQSLFAGVLLVVLGLELMDTLRNYFIEHRLRVEFLISVALIAVARHVIQIDYEHASAMTVV